MTLLKGWAITLEIREGKIRGVAACNSYGGPARITESSFETSNLAVTEMGCSGRVQHSQDTYLAALVNVESISRRGGTLTLIGPNAELIFGYVPPPPTASLVDTTWRLETLLQGRGPEGFATSATRATLRLSGNGTLKGSTGCRRLTGEWTENGDEIILTRFSARGHCSQFMKDQDDHVVGVLGDGFTATIEGRQLTVFARHGGQGLIYVTD